MDEAKMLVSVSRKGVEINTNEVGNPDTVSLMLRNGFVERIATDTRVIQSDMKKDAASYPETHSATVFGNIKTILNEKDFLQDVYGFLKEVVDFPEDIPNPDGINTRDWSRQIDDVFLKFNYPRKQADIIWTGMDQMGTPSWKDVTDTASGVHMPFLTNRAERHEGDIRVFINDGCTIKGSLFYDKFIKYFPVIGEVDIVDCDKVPIPYADQFEDIEDFYKQTGYVSSMFESAAVQGLLYDRFGIISIQD